MLKSHPTPISDDAKPTSRIQTSLSIEFTYMSTAQNTKYTVALANLLQSHLKQVVSTQEPVKNYPYLESERKKL